MTPDQTPRSTSPRSPVQQRVVAPLILGVAGLICIANLRMENEKGFAQNPLRTSFDQRDRLLLDEYHQRSYQTPARSDIVILAIDDASQKLDTLWPEEIEESPALKAIKSSNYPWPRRVWAHLLDRVFSAGAKYVFLDLTFKGPSPDPEDDRQFREALERHKGKVVLGAKFEWESVASATAEEGTEQAKLMRPESTFGYTQETMPFDVGLLNFWTDEDTVIREAQYAVTPSQAELRFLRLSMGTKAKVIAAPNEKPLLSIANIVASKLGPDPMSGVAPAERIRFSSGYTPISLHQIFVPNLWKDNLADGAVFKDKVVFVGATATDLQDFQKIPHSIIPGVELHAHAVSALMAHSFIHLAPEWWRWVSIAVAVLLAWLVVTFVRQPLLCLLTLALLVVGGLYSSYLVFDRLSIESSPLSPLLALGLCGATGLTANFVIQLRESRKLHRFLARYTSPELANEMMSDRAGLYTTLQGAERTVTIFFSDVRGFTSMSENMTPTEVVTQLNEYLSRMVERVITHRGIVDKFIGDAVMAEWGSTRVVPDEAAYKQDAINAVTASLAMRQALVELNNGWRERGIAELAIGMGIHQGDVVVGNIGSEAPYEKMDLTVIGDAVNLASRLEGATKEYGVDLIISDAVRQHVKEAFLCRSADLVAVKGKAKPVDVACVISPIDAPRPPGLETFEIGIKLYRDPGCRFAEAEAAFNQAAAEGLDDKLTHVYQDRCKELLANPPETWDGVFKMTKK